MRCCSRAELQVNAAVRTLQLACSRTEHIFSVVAHEHTAPEAKDNQRHAQIVAMSDLERAEFSFLYENREPCNTIALLQLGATVLTFTFTYTVWWAGLFGVIVAAMGYYGSVQPVIQSKVSFIQFVRLPLCLYLLLLLRVVALIVSA